MTLPYTTPELSHGRSDSDIALVESVTPHNYHPLPVVIAAPTAPGSPTSTADATSTAWPATPR